ncbi:subtilisin-like protease SBT4.6 [Impatiens glandulifera]|uniref:subtilisin-like protease SBT4.6 n=1 Tax=Impatiens glandulifera TaxID=253017 RepID=UPI001FB0523E|nr:subtilisin-like protease SBT4.6 [Impatiens glandulifera]
MEGIVSVFESRKLQVQTTRSWDYMGLTLKIPRSPTIESDIIIGHIDTGVLPELKSLSDHNLRRIPKKWRGVCHGGQNFTCNKKLIGARYYAGQSARDIDGHGSQTASVVAGRVVNNANFVGIANGTARGGVPSARIATYTVCDEYCYDRDAMAAFDDAIADGVDIITISIAYSVPVKISENVVAIGSFHAMQKDILTVQGAGNSGINILKTVSSNAPWLFTVAASSIDRKIINKLVLGNGRTFISNALSPFGTGTHNKRLCIYGCIDPDLVKGKIIVCDVNLDKSDVVYAAMVANASGVILRINTSSNDGSSFTPFPTAALNDPDFHYIESYLKSRKKTKAHILKSETIKFHAPIVASFSCKGPNIILPQILKPDITAPGVDILSECPIDIILDKLPGKYTIASGTSISGPHVAGAVAFVKSKHPNWSASAIKSSLMTTAWTMNKKYNVDAELGYGAGHIDPVKAVYPGLVYETFTDDYTNMFCSLGLEGEKLIKMLGAKHKCPKGIRVFTKDLNYPTMSAPVYSNSNLSFKIQFTRIVTNIGHANSTYHAQISTEDNNIYINVEPSVISFVKLNQRKRVRSPILLYRASII